MRILPVLDLQNGVVVRGVGGRRQEYRPVVSRLTSSSCPLDVVLAFRAHFDFDELYLADLDAIGGRPPAWDTYAALGEAGFRLNVDAGVRTTAAAKPLADAGVEGIVAGLETLAGPEVVRDLCRELGSDRILFSLDLKEGRPLGNLAAWHTTEAWPIVERAVHFGVRRMIVLDLARVGRHCGTGTEEFCARLVREFPGVEVIAGGGVRDENDLARLQQAGVKAVLIASALHDGRLRSGTWFPRSAREPLAGHSASRSDTGSSASLDAERPGLHSHAERGNEDEKRGNENS
jgi:phosphoribosylformimino-5-aminoimidazole carboxamide ribotide isomerase